MPQGPDLVVAVSRDGDEWRWGQTTVGRLGDLTVDFLKRVVWLAPIGSDNLETIVAVRAQVANVLEDIREDRRSLNEFWTQVSRGEYVSLDGIPARKGPPNKSATNFGDLDEWITRAVPAWDTAPSPDVDTAAAGDTVKGTTGSTRRAKMHQQSLRLATILGEHRDQIRDVIDHPNPFVDPSGVELVEVKALNGWLLADQDPKSVLDHMLRLDVVQLATSGAVVQEEQEVELVQVSCTDPEAITGMQMHHFGAFYRAPWRVNDWIEGRIDGAMQVVRLLLSPERLRQRGYTKDELLDHLHAIAVPPGPHQAFLEARWKERASAYVEEIDRVLDGTSTSAALDKIAEAVSMPLRLAALEEDLPALANAILGENGDTSNSSAAWLASYQAAIETQIATPPADPTDQRSRQGTSGTCAMRCETLAPRRSRMTSAVTPSLARPPTPPPSQQRCCRHPHG